jgi:glycerol-3-phosphate dehydrogenase
MPRALSWHAATRTSRRACRACSTGACIEEIVGEMRMVAEGIHTCRVALELGKRYGVEMPITREIDRVVRGDVTALQAYRGLVRHPPVPRANDCVSSTTAA